MSAKTDQERAWQSLVRGFVVLFLFSPPAFSITDAFLRLIGLGTCSNGCPNMFAIVLHALVFALLDYFLISVYDN